jgi:hypothetical protein
MRIPLPFTLAALLIPALPGLGTTPLHGQTLEGRIVDAETGDGVGGAFVELLTEDDQSVSAAFTDRGGRFRLDIGAATAASHEGDFFLMAGALGYGRGLWELSTLDFDGNNPLGDLAIEPVPIQLAPLEVEARRSRLTPGREWVRQRQLLGRGTFYSGAVLAALEPPSLTAHLAQQVGLRDRWDERGVASLVSDTSCMLVFVNEWPLNAASPAGISRPRVGVPINQAAAIGSRVESQNMGFPSLDDIPLEWIAAVEVYHEMRDVPPGRLQRTMGGRFHACAVVNLWTWDSW